MSFDQKTRNLLQRTVSACRTLLSDECAAQRRSLYGIDDAGVAAPLEVLGHLPDEEMQVARLLRERLDHLVAGLLAQGKKEAEARKEAVNRLTREQAFTILNRLAALRMAEERGIVLECVRQGVQSEGFELFLQSAGSAYGDRFGAYRAYLWVLFDELAIDLGILYDRWDPMGLLFPRQDALESVLKELNGTGTAGAREELTPEQFNILWAEDETIGWIYQYYNDPAERKKMRDESSAPRNSRELAVRNQFFTPRYVVEFLTDNTMGRLWYEMTKGETRLKEQCRYLVRRSMEFFLPDPNTVLWHNAEGIDAFQKFSRTAAPQDLPQDPALGALLGWIGKIKPNGFEEELHHVGRSHQQVVDDILDPLSAGSPSPRLPLAHPVELMQALWRLGYELAKHGYGRPMEATSKDSTAGPLWNRLRESLLADSEESSKEDLLMRPVFVPHRDLKDPREIRFLDPACGSMHFGLYAFDLFITIYEEAWKSGCLPSFDFSRAKPPFPHHSVKLKPGAILVHSNDLHTEIAADSARVVVLEQSDPGDGLWSAGPYLAPPARNYRPAIAWEAALADFCYQEALAAGRFTSEAGERFVRETGCWLHDLADASTPNEVERCFAASIPRLIIEHNLHGIDIDPRCAQIAGLSLWLRAQKEWQRLGLTPAERPAIKRSNIVCAEPMPGEKELLRDFIEREFPAEERVVCLRLLEAIFDKMQLAGEAGSLLKIEEEIRSAIEDARRDWEKIGEHLPGLAADNPTSDLRPLTSDCDPRNLTTDFWEHIEERIYAALRDYAEQAENGGGFQRRLFAEDAARGFAFIDICKKLYDVALMNPPFGDASLPSKPYIEETYGDTKGDVYKAFVECFHARLVPAGYLGIISSRTGFFLGQSEDWRTRVVLRLFRPIALADLGSGVLDAMVEVAAYVLRSLSALEARDLNHSIVPVLEKVVRDSQDRFSLPKWQAARGGLKRHQAVAELEHLEAQGFVQRISGHTVRYTPRWHLVKEISALPEPVFPPLVCVRALGEQDKSAALAEGLRSLTNRNIFICNPRGFFEMPSATFAYWVGNKVQALYTRNPLFAADGREARRGPSTGDDTRRVRCWWEIYSTDNSRERGWARLSKGGNYSPFYYDVHLVVAWDEHRFTYSGFFGRPGRMIAKLESCDCFFRPGLTWPRRSQKGLSARPLPSGCIFADKSPTAFVAADDSRELLAYLAFMNSSAFRGLIALQMAFGSYETGVFQRTPVPHIEDDMRARLAVMGQRAWATIRQLNQTEAISHAYVIPCLLAAPGSTLAQRVTAWTARVRKSEETVTAIQAEIDDLAFRLYGLDAADHAALTSTLATEAISDISDAVTEAGEAEDDEAPTVDATALTADLLGYGLGVAFGRWDIRYATGAQAAPELLDPFAPLPVCPPGQLQNAQGLPAHPEDVPAAYPIRITWDGILADDPDHPLDIERRVREVIAIIWSAQAGGTTAEAIEHEAREILGVKSLRDYFRKPAGFFADHLKRYSKSRRQAPIYWPLSTASGSYTLWIYYHRLTPDTLYKCLQQFVEPKIKDVEQDIHRLRTMLTADEAGTKERKQLADAETLLKELKELHAELTLWAPKWKPNLNDGVLITASPLWKLFRLPKWRNDLEACWKELEKGDYDWARLAYTLWPARVREKCKTDRSFAIAHDLEEICEVKPPEPKKKRSAQKAAKRANDQTGSDELNLDK